jgi:hypothetical protein
MKFGKRKAYSGIIGGLMFMLVMVTVFSMIAVVVALNIDAAILRFNQQSLITSKSEESLTLCLPPSQALTISSTCYYAQYLRQCTPLTGTPIVVFNLGYVTSRLLYSFIVQGQGTITSFTQLGSQALQKYTLTFSPSGKFQGCSGPVQVQPVLDPISNNNPPNQTVVNLYVLYFSPNPTASGSWIYYYFMSNNLCTSLYTLTAKDGGGFANNAQPNNNQDPIVLPGQSVCVNIIINGGTPNQQVWWEIPGLFPPAQAGNTDSNGNINAIIKITMPQQQQSGQCNTGVPLKVIYWNSPQPPTNGDFGGSNNIIDHIWTCFPSSGVNTASQYKYGTITVFGNVYLAG